LVQKSLMPKGVDHWQARFLQALPSIECKNL